MSDEIEAAGALATAGLVAGRVGAAGASHLGPRDGVCANCGAALNGAFCQACGQPAHVHRSLLHLTEEMLHGVLHFDTKGWRTLPLLVFRPGLLTRRYIDGQRQRHVSPLALFLFTVFMMFFVFSLTTHAPQALPAGAATSRAEVAEALAKADAAVGSAETRLGRIQGRADEASDAQDELTEARAEQKALRLALQAFDAVSPAASTASAASTGQAAAGQGLMPSTPGWMRQLRSTPVNTGHPRLDAAIQRAVDNPELTLYKLKNTAYKFSFMLVPISLPFLWLMFFWRRGIAVYDHAVFALYSLSFMSLLFIVIALVSTVHAGGVAAVLLLVVPPLHMAMQLRETYRLDWFSTAWRTLTLLTVTAIVLTLFLLFIVVVTMG